MLRPEVKSLAGVDHKSNYIIITVHYIFMKQIIKNKAMEVIPLVNLTTGETHESDHPINKFM